jgi:hypothetical protein
MDAFIFYSMMHDVRLNLAHRWITPSQEAVNKYNYKMSFKST